MGFHEGELAVQQRAGVRADAARLAGMLGEPDLDGGAGLFLAGGPSPCSPPATRGGGCGLAADRAARLPGRLRHDPGRARRAAAG